ncbi:mitochondrial fission 1 protein-like [Oppia nitens]|uniref:mitochondrial fission 1 protein-like n=1 Tax=Oppia nitens TaxID=1686743 RepID=UPI0023DAC77C|nr:mitochondrial fission 1 protein-like [Oppia nitens]
MQAILEDYISPDELKKFWQTYENERRKSKDGLVSPQTRFEYALALIRSRYPTDIHRGITELEDLCSTGDPQARRDYLYYLALANTKLKEYQRARDCIKKFLSVEPENRQAQELDKLIKDKLTKEGLLGMAMVGGAAVAIGGLIVAGISMAKK